MFCIRDFFRGESGRVSPRVTQTAEADRMILAEAISDGPSWFLPSGPWHSWAGPFFCWAGYPHSRRGVPWSLDLFRYMFKISKVGALEGNSYAVVSSQADCGMAVFPSSLKLWKAKFVFVSGFPGDRHPFRARFPECHTFIRHPRLAVTPELQAHAQKLLEDCWPKPPHVYTVCTEQNLAECSEVGGSGVGGEEVEDDEEVESDEESEQPPYSEGIADVDPSVGDMNPVDMIRKAKLLARNRSRGEEVQQKMSSENASGPIVPVPNPETASTRNLRKRKVIQVEDEDTASE
ncbi:unnamed protein product [Cuscuta campestris]|uniref:Uncharacterized protein n=1 Tax=Cuscuta campestris TaxID=132261 RepID=A0A484LPF6_9ASTE|nr:unnamed protein product [Cuscuta campestris]